MSSTKPSKPTSPTKPPKTVSSRSSSSSEISPRVRPEISPRIKPLPSLGLTGSSISKVKSKDDMVTFDRACDEDDIDTIEDMFPHAFDHLSIRALPMISSWDIYCKFVLLPTKSKVYKFLKTGVIPDLNLNESGELADVILRYRTDWMLIAKPHGVFDYPDNDYCDLSFEFYDYYIKLTSFGHWCSRDLNGLTFPEACFQIKKIYHLDLRFYPIDTVIEYFDALPFPSSKTIDIINASDIRIDKVMSMLPDNLTGQTNSTEARIEDYIEDNKSQTYGDPYKEDNILRSIAANGKFHLFNSYFELYGKECTLPMVFKSADIIDKFNKNHGHHYNYDLRDSEGKTLIFYNQRQSTVERTSKKELKRYVKIQQKSE